MSEIKPKKIAVLNGILHGHFTGSVEVVRELAALGHDVTCFVTDELLKDYLQMFHHSL